MDKVSNKEASMETSPSPFENLDVRQHIISFVGKNQYRFVAAISRNFQAGYLQLYPDNKQTYYNVSTVEHADICFESHDAHRSSTLCKTAARHGNLSVLMYLESRECTWDTSTRR
jgi:hypothetical protein